MRAPRAARRANTLPWRPTGRANAISWLGFLCGVGGTFGSRTRELLAEPPARPRVETRRELGGAQPQQRDRHIAGRRVERGEHALALEVQLIDLVEHVVAQLDHEPRLARDVDAIEVEHRVAEVPRERERNVVALAALAVVVPQRVGVARDERLVVAALAVDVAPV